jgi:hypothetical protein
MKLVPNQFSEPAFFGVEILETVQTGANVRKLVSPPLKLLQNKLECLSLPHFSG